MDKSKKYRDIDTNEKRRDWDEVSAGASSIGAGGGGWDDEIRTVIDLDMGLCTNCKHLRGYQTRYGTKKVWCYNHDMVLNPADPIADCVSYTRRGEMDLDEMKTIAWRIEPAKDFEMGFQPHEKEEDKDG